MFVNLIGASPFYILSALEILKDSEEAMKVLRLISVSSLKADQELLKRAARTLRGYERAFIKYEAYGLLPLSGAARLRAAAEVLGYPETSGIIDKFRASSGAPAKDRWRSTIKSLVCACELPLEERLGKTTGGKIMWTAITAILMCAFPEMFRAKKNRDDDNWPDNENDELKGAIRKVKDGYRFWQRNEYDPMIPSEMQ
jgi:hypothetical protein